MFDKWTQVLEGIKRLSRECEDLHGIENDIALAHSLMQDRIEALFYKKQLVAYAETWRVTLEEAEFMQQGLRIDTLSKDLNYGPVLWIAQVTIHPDYRRNFLVIDVLRNRVFHKNTDAEYLGWYRLKKKRGFIVPFKGLKESIYG